MELMQDICKGIELRKSISDDVVPTAFEMEWATDSVAFKTNGKSLFRILNGSYRNVVKKLAGVAKDQPTKSYQARLDLLTTLAEIATVRSSIANRDELGRSHFGVAWAQHDTDCQDQLEAVCWIDDHMSDFESIDRMASMIEEFGVGDSVAEQLAPMESMWKEWDDSWQSVCEETQLDSEIAFGVDQAEKVNFEALVERLQLWRQNTQELNAYQQMWSVGNELESVGLGEVRRCVNNGGLDVHHAVDSLMLHRCEVVYQRLRNDTPELDGVDGAVRSELVDKFKQQDKQLQRLAAHEIVLEHHKSIPQGTSGAMGILRGEIAKKRRHMPIRKLLDEAGEAVALIKPVFLMSPISISRFLRPGGLSFDLLLIDEASQIRPEQAMGAMLRAKQVVVVGDQKQMPPTSFFDKQITAVEEEYDEEKSEEQLLREQTADMESVLSLCTARGLHNAMLKWHYRSEHPSLIEVSNHEFYENNLVYPPSLNFGVGSAGLSLVKVDGIYDRARGRNNRKEAEEICSYIVEHVSNYPNQSLGVVALSTAQRTTLQNAIDDLCREHPDVERFCNTDSDEPFFVKNLENVQGDERDIICISIGYGPDKDGYFGQNFGPVSSEGGERRLNVLFTRARKKCVVFASITHDNIRTDTSQHRGPQVLKQFLKYADTGEMDVPLITEDEMDSPFERDVAEVLINQGHKVEPQVGSSGFKIDLAVHDPDNEGHFLLAVECDGARYHSSSWARERDRLRQEVLEGKGWRFHRIWSTDWFYSRDKEIAKLLNAVDVARAAQTDFRDSGSSTAVIVSEDGQDESDSIWESESEIFSEETTTSLSKTTPYVECQLEVDPIDLNLELLDVLPTTLSKYVVPIVQQEQPVHVSVVYRKIVQLWNIKKIGRLIREHLNNCILMLVRNGTIFFVEDDNEFLTTSESLIDVALRDRSETKLREIRQSVNVPKAEIRNAIAEVVYENVSLTVDECFQEVTRMLGIARNKELIDRLRGLAGELEQAGRITQKGEVLSRISR